MKYDEFIFKELTDCGIIPLDGVFTITEEMKIQYVKLYPIFSGSSGKLTPKETKFALKLAGLSLLKLNETRRENTPCAGDPRNRSRLQTTQSKQKIVSEQE